MYICHCTTKLKQLQTQDAYSEFFRDYKLSTKAAPLFMRTYISYEKGKVLNHNRLAYNCERTTCIESIKSSLLLAAWYADYFYNHSYEKKGPVYLCDLMDSGINYSKLNFSDAYLSLYPLTKFYKYLALDIDEDRYESVLYEKDYVSKENIESALLKMDTDVIYDDIKDDINLHSILCPYKDYYIWGSIPLLRWLLEEDHSVMNNINLNKILSVEHNFKMF